QKNKIEEMAGDVKKAYEVEKKAKEELQRLDEAKSQFMMATQHHLRTPLTALKGYLSLTLDGDFGPISDVVKEKLGFCFESTNRLIKLVNEFLDISKLQLGRDILDIKETSIVEMLKDVIVEVKPEADKKGIYLTLTLPSEPTSLVMADAGKLREALYNLTDNAVKYTEKGGVKVELQFVKKGKNNCAMVIVTDTGIGMTKEEAADVFGRQFERGKEAKKVYALGRGIGLFITASIIKAHKGKIWADSLGAGKGSAFYVELIAKK
ncbi:MAG: HAMP domain-containing sensor histidine kinase, partial [Proteobacteria bacterium]|nr:HAMP domain-containing sensor histidine kinase [Pseudomonadota bacterium]